MDQDTSFVITPHENASVFGLSQEQVSELIRDYKTVVSSDTRIPEPMFYSTLITQLVDRLFQQSSAKTISCPYKVSLSHRKGVANLLIVLQIPEVMTVEIRKKIDSTVFDNYAPPNEHVSRNHFRNFILRNFMVSTPTVGRNFVCRGKFVYAKYGAIRRFIGNVFGFGALPNTYF